MILLYQTSSRSLALFLSLFMKIESYEVGTRANPHILGTFDIARGYRHLDFVNQIPIIGMDRLLYDQLGFLEREFVTVGVNKINVYSYLGFLGGFVGLSAIISISGVLMSEFLN